jgi:CcmD family protein
MTYLRIAYAAVWIIHGTYLGVLISRYNRAKREMESLRSK